VIDRGENYTHSLAVLTFRRSQYTCDDNHNMVRQIYTFMDKRKLKISPFIKLNGVEVKRRVKLYVHAS